MTASSTAFQTTTTRLTAAQTMLDVDSDEDSVMSSSHSCTDTDEDEESIESIIRRYTKTRLELNQTISSEDDEPGRNTPHTDDDYEAVVSKPVAWLKEQQFEAPEFDQRLRGYTEISSGESVTFVAQYRAHPAPTVKWFKDDQEVCAATGRLLLESSSSEFEGVIRLTINDVSTADEGAYKCKVENQEGVASTTGYLSVSGGESRSRSRTASRTTSSRNGKLSPGSTISSPSRSPGVSTPPVLRSIAEQKSIEEKEELELCNQPPSPLQAFIDSIRHSAKSKHPPIFYGCEQLFGDELDENDDYDVFDSEEEPVSPTTSIDCLEQLLSISPTLALTGEDVEVCRSPTRTYSASSAASGDTVTMETSYEMSVSAAETLDFTWHSFNNLDPELDGKDNLKCFDSSRVQDSEIPSEPTPFTSESELKTTELDPSGSRFSSTCHQRRLRQLQLKHRLAIDLPDVTSSMTSPSPVCSDETWTSNSRNEMAYDSGFSDAVTISSPSISGCSGLSTPADSKVLIGIGHVLHDIQDSILTLIDNPVAQFYIVFVAVTSALANTFDIQPPWLVLIVTVVSFASFQLFGCYHPQHHHRHPEQHQHQQPQPHANQDNDISYMHCSALNTRHQTYCHNSCSVAQN